VHLKVFGFDASLEARSNACMHGKPVLMVQSLADQKKSLRGSFPATRSSLIVMSFC
jgi:hypothetical protein